METYALKPILSIKIQGLFLQIKFKEPSLH